MTRENSEQKDCGHYTEDELLDMDDDNEPCSHCGGEGFCWDGSDPLGDCPDDIHKCHACHGSGKAKDQVIW